MTPEQTADILNLIASTDGRRLTTQMPAAWHTIIGTYPYTDCKQAVTDHYRESTEWLTPAHIIRRAKTIRNQRIKNAGPIEPNPTDSQTTHQELTTRRQLTQAIADGTLTTTHYHQYKNTNQPLTTYAKHHHIPLPPPQLDHHHNTQPIPNHLRGLLTQTLKNTRPPD